MSQIKLDSIKGIEEIKDTAAAEYNGGFYAPPHLRSEKAKEKMREKLKAAIENGTHRVLDKNGKRRPNLTPGLEFWLMRKKRLEEQLFQS